MTRVTVTILALIAAFSVNSYANDTESKLQQALEQRAQKLSAAIKKFDTMRKAMATVKTSDRENALRILCRRMKAETKAINNSIDSMDVYLQIQQFNKNDENELKRTNQNISNIKSEIQRLKESLGQTKSSTNEIAAK